jgi:hypothetical protein
MVTASWQLTVAGDRRAVLDIVSDYSRAAEWTPAVRTASKARARARALETYVPPCAELAQHISIAHQAR